jgi:glyoxylase I family protein
MFSVLGIDHVVLRTQNVDGLLEFYTVVLGCPLERQLAEYGLFQFRAGQSLIDLIDVDGPLGKVGGEAPGRTGRNVDHFCLRIDPFDADDIRSHLDTHDVSYGDVEERYGAEGNGPAIYIEDPDGNTVELKGPGAI